MCSIGLAGGTSRKRTTEARAAVAPTKTPAIEAINEDIVKHRTFCSWLGAN